MSTVEIVQIVAGAIATFYLRHVSKKDSKAVIKDTASDDDMRAVKRSLSELRAEFDLLKTQYFKNNPVVEDRSPKDGDPKKW